MVVGQLVAPIDTNHCSIDTTMASASPTAAALALTKLRAYRFKIAKLHFDLTPFQWLGAPMKKSWVQDFLFNRIRLLKFFEMFAL